MSRHWDPRSSGWLSDAQFRALSARERRSLSARKAQGKRQSNALKSYENVVQLRPSGRIAGHAASMMLTVVLAVAAGVSFAAVRAGSLRLPSIPAFASASAPVRASFGYCYAGGGTNCVVDGDTFYIAGDKVRIADIDAPETHPPRCEYEAQLGNQPI